MKRMYQFHKKLVSALVVISLLVSQSMGFAAPAISSSLSVLPTEFQTQNLINSLVIPEELGSIEERFIDPSADQNTPMIVHIQDAHANYEAQRNIQAIIDYLNQKYGISLVLLEGGAEQLDPKLLQIFKNPEYNAEMVDLLVKKGEVTGAEAYLVQKSYEEESQMDAFGIENADKYRQDLEHFRRIWPETESGRNFSNHVIQLIDRAGSRTANKKLRDFMREWQSYKESRSHLNSYLNILKNRAWEILKLDLTNPRNQIEWPTLLRVYKLKEMEPKLNLQEAKDDWQKAKQFLKPFPINPVLIEELENKLYGKKTNQFDWPESTRDLFQYLLELTHSNGFTFKDYPNLAVWVGNSILRNEIESNEIFEEIDRLNNLILDRLAPTNQEKQIVELYRQNYLLKDLYSLELTRDNLIRMKAAEELFKPSEVIRRIQAIDPTTDFDDAQVLKAVEQLYFNCLKSYEFAYLRESAFFESLSNAIKRTGKNKAITVCGGFHTKGFSEIFKANKMSYVILSPRITVFDDVEKEHTNYINSLMQIVPGRAETASSTRTNPAYIDGQSNLGANPGYRTTSLKPVIDEVAGRHEITPANAPVSFNSSPLVSIPGVSAPRAQRIGAVSVTSGAFEVGANGEIILPETHPAARAPDLQSSLGRLLTVARVVGGIKTEVPSAPTEKARSELRNASSLEKKERIGDIEIHLRRQEGVGIVLSIQGDREDRVHPAFVVAEKDVRPDAHILSDAYSYAIALAKGEQRLPEDSNTTESLPSQIRSAVESFIDREQLAPDLRGALTARRAELRALDLPARYSSDGSGRDVLSITGNLFARSELRLASNLAITAVLDGLGVAPIVTVMDVVTSVMSARFNRLYDAIQNILRESGDATQVTAQQIRVLSNVPKDLTFLDYDLFTAATQPEHYQISLVLPSGASDADLSSLFESIKNRLIEIREKIGASADLPFSEIIRLVRAGQTYDETAQIISGVVSKAVGSKFEHLAVLADDEQLFEAENFRRRFPYGTGLFRIHNDLGQSAAADDYLKLSVITAKLTFGLEPNPSRYRTGIVSALELITTALEIVKEAERRIAVAA